MSEARTAEPRPGVVSGSGSAAAGASSGVRAIGRVAAVACALTVLLPVVGGCPPERSDPGPGPAEIDAPDAHAGDVTGVDASDGDAAGPPTRAYFDQCAAGRGPDDACYAERRAPGSDEVALATAISRRFMEEHPPAELRWDWSEGVLVYALTELHRVTKDPALPAYARAWLDHHIADGYDVIWSDSCPPGLTASALWEIDGAAPYRDVVETILTYVFELAPRTTDGGLGHLGILDPDTPSLWVDTLMMVGVTLTRWSEASGDQAALDEAALQARVFTDHMQDASGWYTHAWNWVHGDQDPGVFWGRGNGWVAVASHELLRQRRLRGEDDAELGAAAALLTGAIVASQDPATGLWWTVLNRPGETYLETSASALFAYALARGFRYGWRDDSVLAVVAAALAGIRDRVAYDPTGRPIVTGVSGPTTVTDFEGYADIEVEDDVPFGVGAVILALTEASGLPLPPTVP